MFSQMLDQMKHDVISIVSRAQLRSEQDVEAMEEQRSAAMKMQFRHAEAQSAIASGAAVAGAGASSPSMPTGPGALPEQVADPVQPFVRSEAKVGRNEPCPCGSGQKYKRCHGKLRRQFSRQIAGLQFFDGRTYYMGNDDQHCADDTHRSFIR